MPQALALPGPTGETNTYRVEPRGAVYCVAADEADFQAVLFEGDGDALRALNMRIAQRPGPLVSVHGLSADALAAGASYAPDRLLAERSISVNTAAAGGNASLMTIG
ncbi:bifunctional proline oxidoreductase/transcriptional repressor [Bordetella pertussis]|nr:bifunctional proline oxidoreductase/transcriptional repressor [Bordetella pertussis]